MLYLSTLFLPPRFPRPLRCLHTYPKQLTNYKHQQTPILVRFVLLLSQSLLKHCSHLKTTSVSVRTRKNAMQSPSYTRECEGRKRTMLLRPTLLYSVCPFLHIRTHPLNSSPAPDDHVASNRIADCCHSSANQFQHKTPRLKYNTAHYFVGTSHNLKLCHHHFQIT